MSSSSRNLIMLAGTLLAVMIFSFFMMFQGTIRKMQQDSSGQQESHPTNLSDMSAQIEDLKERSRSVEERIRLTQKAIDDANLKLEELRAEVAADEGKKLSRAKAAKQKEKLAQIDALNVEIADLRNTLKTLEASGESEADSYEREISAIEDSNRLITEQIKDLTGKGGSDESNR